MECCCLRDGLTNKSWVEGSLLVSIEVSLMRRLSYGVQWNLRKMKVLGQPIILIIWRFSLVRGTNVLKCMQMVHWKTFHYERFSLLGGSLSEVPL